MGKDTLYRVPIPSLAARDLLQHPLESDLDLISYGRSLRSQLCSKLPSIPDACGQPELACLHAWGAFIGIETSVASHLLSVRNISVSDIPSAGVQQQQLQFLTSIDTVLCTLGLLVRMLPQSSLRTCCSQRLSTIAHEFSRLQDTWNILVGLWDYCYIDDVDD